MTGTLRAQNVNQLLDDLKSSDPAKKKNAEDLLSRISRFDDSAKSYWKDFSNLNQLLRGTFEFPTSVFTHEYESLEKILNEKNPKVPPEKIPFMMYLYLKRQALLGNVSNLDYLLLYYLHSDKPIIRKIVMDHINSHLFGKTPKSGFLPHLDSPEHKWQGVALNLNKPTFTGLMLGTVEDLSRSDSDPQNRKLAEQIAKRVDLQIREAQDNYSSPYRGFYQHLKVELDHIKNVFGIERRTGKSHGAPPCHRNILESIF